MTSRMQTAVIHANDSRWFLNMHALHNAHLIRETVPENLWKPKHYFHDHLAEHKRFAAQARAIGRPKRLESRAKAKATRTKNQELKKGKQRELPPQQMILEEDELRAGDLNEALISGSH